MLPTDPSEYEAHFGDSRLSRRIVRIVERMSIDPSATLPALLGDGAELDAAYLFFANERVTREKILAPHRACTWERSKAFKTVLSDEDTTEVRFGGDEPRTGLGVLQHGGQGFRLHASLAVGFDGARGIPLGVVAERVVVRTKERQVNSQPTSSVPSSGSVADASRRTPVPSVPE